MHAECSQFARRQKPGLQRPCAVHRLLTMIFVGETTAVTRTRALKGGYFGSASDRRPAMLTRTGSVLAVLACCSCFLSTAQAQKVEEDDVQVLKPVASPQMPAKSAKLPEAAKRVLALTNELRKDK